MIVLPSYQPIPLSNPSCCAEKAASYVLLTERHVQALWLEQKYFKNLYLSTGEKIEILSPGIWNTEAGPDFLKAHLRMSNQDWRGDIEIHLHEEGWKQHGHQDDDRYSNVILHLVFWENKNKRDHQFPTAYLENQITIPVAKLVQRIDLELYPYHKFVGAGRCAKTVFNRFSEEETNAFFQSASYWRLGQKQQFLANRFSDENLQLVAGIAMALGYKHNAEAFLELFEVLLSYRDLPPDELFAIALGCCGFFEKEAITHWQTSLVYQNWRSLWWGYHDQVLHQTQLRLDHIRPLNHPVRRLAYLVKLLHDPYMERITATVFDCWREHCEEPLRLKQRLLDCIPTYQDPYWNFHYTFETEPKTKYLSLMGEDLKMAILINTILPLLYAKVENKEAFQQLYGILPAAKANKSRYLQQRFFGNSSGKNLLKLAQMEQGAYQLHRDYCMHFEASCEGCPFYSSFS